MFIIDANNQLIAAEPADLARWDIPDIFTAARAFREGDLRLDREASRLIINGEEENFACRIERVESLLGPWFFCHTSLSKERDTERSTDEETQAPTAVFPDFESEEDEILGILSAEETKERKETLPTEEEGSEDELLQFLSGEETHHEEVDESVRETPETGSNSEIIEEDEALSLLGSEESKEENVEEKETTQPAEAGEELSLLPLEEPEEENVEAKQTAQPAETEEELSPLPLEEPEEENVEAEQTVQPSETEEELSLLPLEEPEEENVEAEQTAQPAEAEEELSPLPLEEPEEENVKAEQSAQPADAEEPLSLLPLDESEEESLPQSMESRKSLHEPKIDTISEKAEETAIPELKTEEAMKEPDWEEEFFGASTPEESIPALEGVEESPEAWKEVEKEFHPDLLANAKRLELTESEYNDLLKEFIQDSYAMEDQLVDSDEQRYKNAAAILKDAINLLYLQPLDRLFTSMEKVPTDQRRTIVKEYRRLLFQLEDRIGFHEAQSGVPKTEKEEEEANEILPTREETIPEAAPLMPGETSSTVSRPESEAEKKEEMPYPPLTEEETVSQEETATVQESTQEETQEEHGEETLEDFLGDLHPIPIEFSLHIAAEELNLPEDLVLEFINDFDKQGHEYLPVLIDAYQKKDLDHLQKTAHMLKGAASNLRIEAMVDNLYDLQFDNDIERAPERIRRFAAQLMSLDNYLQQMNK